MAILLKKIFRERNAQYKRGGRDHGCLHIKIGFGGSIDEQQHHIMGILVKWFCSDHTVVF